MTKHGTAVSLCVAFPYKLTIYSWGCSKDGQLSSSDKSDQNKPTYAIPSVEWASSKSPGVPATPLS